MHRLPLAPEELAPPHPRAVPHPAVPVLGAADLVRSLRGPPGAYIHVPFCSQICPFCPYNKVLFRPEWAERYFDALEREIRRVQAALGGSFTSLYIGGGTPTLCLDGLARVLPLLEVEHETAIECLPTHATPAILDALVELGISALSLGVQSFSPDVLRHLARPTTAADNIAALAAARPRISLLDVDLMFDVAYEDERTFLEDFARCLDADVDQVSTYPVMRFGYTPFGKGPHLAEREHRVLHEAAVLARGRGYERRSVWTFNRVGSPSYSSITRPFYLGFGAGAASYTGGLFSVNTFQLDRYQQLLAPEGDDDRLPAERVFELSPLLSSSYAVFWQMYTGQLDLAELRERFGRRAGLFWRGVCEALVRTGQLARGGGDGYRLTDKGYDRYHDLERWVTYHFIEPLWQEMMAGHAQDGGTASRGAGWLRLPAEHRTDPVWRLARSALRGPRAAPPEHRGP